MPWTRKQVKYLLSKGSPLSESKKESMKAELHRDPSKGHMRKASKTSKHHSAMDGKFIDDRRNL